MPANETQAHLENVTRRPWKLQDAKAKFSKVVRLVRKNGPQRVTLHGLDAVVIVSAQS